MKDEGETGSSYMSAAQHSTAQHSTAQLHVFSLKCNIVLDPLTFNHAVSSSVTQTPMLHFKGRQCAPDFAVRAGTM